MSTRMLRRVIQGCLRYPGADPGFLERGFIYTKVRGGRFADFLLFFLNIP